MMNQEQITERVKGLIRRKGMTPRAFALEIGIDDGNFARLLNGKRRWGMGHLEKVAAFGGCTVNDLLGNVAQVPLLAITNGHGPDKFTIPAHPVKSVPAPVHMEGAMLEDIYAVQLGADLGLLRKGTTIYCQKESFTRIVDGDLVMYSADDGDMVLRQVRLNGDGTVKLFTATGELDLTLPANRLRLCDRVIGTAIL